MPEGNPEDKIGRLRRAMYSRKIGGKIGREERHALSNADSGIQQDWSPPGDDAEAPGVMAAPRIVRYTRRALFWLLGIAALFFLASAGVFIWYIMGGFGTDVRSSNIEIEVNGPLAIIGGEPAELQIVVTNRNKAPLEYADLIVSYPAGTRAVTDLRADLPQQRISLGTIEAGGTRQGTVSAILVGQGGASAVIEVSVEYQVAGATAVFSATKEYEFTYAASPITLSVEAKSEVIPGQPIILTATVSANTNTVLKDALLQLEAPFGFTLSAANPAVGEDLIWSLGDLRPGDTRTITLQGVMKGQPGDERVFRFRAGTKQGGEETGIILPLVEVTQKVVITQPFIGLTLAINGNTAQSAAAVSPGDTVVVNVGWKNELATPITNAVVVANLSGMGIDGAEVRTNDGFYRSADRTVVWDASTSRGALSTLAPGANGQVSFSFKVPSEAQLANARNPSLTISIRAAADRSDGPDVPQGLESTAVRTVKVQTAVSALAHGFHDSSPFGPTGPVPPKVNQETTYAILLSAGNSTNPVENAKITAQLPPYIRWTGIYQPSGENLSFDQKSGVVTWQLGTLSAGAGIGSTPSRQVAFEIGFTPSASQRGQSPALLTDIVLTGTDSFTNTSLRRNASNVTTSQPNEAGFVSSDATVVQ